MCKKIYMFVCYSNANYDEKFSYDYEIKDVNFKISVGYGYYRSNSSNQW